MPMTIAKAAIIINRGVAVKSARSSAMSCGRGAALKM